MRARGGGTFPRSPRDAKDLTSSPFPVVECLRDNQQEGKEQPENIKKRKEPAAVESKRAHTGGSAETVEHHVRVHDTALTYAEDMIRLTERRADYIALNILFEVYSSTAMATPV